VPFSINCVLPAVLILVTVSACSTVPTHLAPQSHETTEAVVVVRARPRLNFTGISLIAGHKYSIRPLPRQQWWDLIKRSTPDGYESDFLTFKLAAARKPLPNSPWFELCGQIGAAGKPFAIGSGAKPIVADASGELALFANDAAHMYWNNFGAIRVAISDVTSEALP
jgi:hypothetical protein